MSKFEKIASCTFNISGCISIGDVVISRKSQKFPEKKFLFEVITKKRVYYIEVCTMQPYISRSFIYLNYFSTLAVFLGDLVCTDCSCLTFSLYI